MLQWIEHYPLHSFILQTMQLPEIMEVAKFPTFSIGCPSKKNHAAEYTLHKHTVVFNEVVMYNEMTQFSFVYFHELMHSTSHSNGRWTRLLRNTSPTLIESIANLEERIADIAALVLVDLFDKPQTKETIIKLPFLLKLEHAIYSNPTPYELPWGEVELAVKTYLKNKACPKVESKLQFYKQVITNNNFCKLYEGLYER